MAMSFTPSDFQQVKFFVFLSVANKLRIPNAEFESPQSLQQQTSAKNPALGQALSNFLSAYDAWYRFHLGVDVADRSGALSPAETAELVRLVEARDTTRASLIEALKNVGTQVASAGVTT
jgi:hypothetical protein